jgi:hypothetical protein
MMSHASTSSFYNSYLRIRARTLLICPLDVDHLIWRTNNISFLYKKDINDLTLKRD